MLRPTPPAPDGSAVRVETSRRTLLRTAAWSAPVVAVATAVPAFAASNGIVGMQQVERTSDTAIRSTGSVRNDTGTSQTVTLTWTWTCDSSGPGAGDFSQGSASRNGWNLTQSRFEAVDGNQKRGFRVVANITVRASTTVPFPSVTVYLSESTDTGGVSATLSAPPPTVVVQPSSYRFPAYVAGRAVSQPRNATAPDIVVHR